MSNKKRIRLKVASPCKADWESMSGDEAIRFCGLCKKNVYQISNMTTDQVEELLLNAEEKKCGRFYQRKDGTLVTSDCSVGLRRKRHKQAAIAAGVGVWSVLGVAMSSAPPPAAQIAPVAETSAAVDTADLIERAQQVITALMGETEETEDHMMIMGAMEYVPEEQALLGELSIEPEND